MINQVWIQKGLQPRSFDNILNFFAHPPQSYFLVNKMLENTERGLSQVPHHQTAHLNQQTVQKSNTV